MTKSADRGALDVVRASHLPGHRGYLDGEVTTRVLGHPVARREQIAEYARSATAESRWCSIGWAPGEMVDWSNGWGGRRGECP